MSVLKRIFGEGLTTGVFTGIAIKTGISADESSISLSIFKTFCEATEGMKSAFNCWGYYAFLVVFIAILGILSFWEIIHSADDWEIGLTVYAAGFLIMLFLILIFM
jgi:hypothetical protein